MSYADIATHISYVWSWKEKRGEGVLGGDAISHLKKEWSGPDEQTWKDM